MKKSVELGLRIVINKTQHFQHHHDYTLRKAVENTCLLVVIFFVDLVLLVVEVVSPVAVKNPFSKKRKRSVSRDALSALLQKNN